MESNGYGEETSKKAEFKERYFDCPPNNSADWAWAQHMLASPKNNGRIGFIVDNGCLFKGGLRVRREISLFLDF